MLLGKASIVKDRGLLGDCKLFKVSGVHGSHTTQSGGILDQ